MDKPVADEIDRLILEMKDDRRDVRSRAAYELGKHDDPRTLPPLIAALSDNDKFVRSWAAGALAKSGPSAIAPLLIALETPDQTVGYYAAVALGELGDLRAVPLLASALRDGDWDIRPTAAAALAGLGDSAALPDRVLTEKGITGADRANILASLREVAYTDDQVQFRIRLPEVSDYCRGRSQSEDDAIRMGAIEALQALGSAPTPDTKASPPQTPAPAPPLQAPVVETPAPPTRTLETAAAMPPEKQKRSLWDRLTGR